jgi:uncharacterized protein with PIN domain
MKTCTKCKETKEFRRFYKNGRGVPFSRCQECMRAISRVQAKERYIKIRGDVYKSQEARRGNE